MNIEDQLDPSVTAFVAPQLEFRGRRLHPYGVARKILFVQATVTEDRSPNSGSWLCVALLFLLSLKPEEAQRLAFNRREFREKALAWFEETGGTIVEADTLAESILSAAEQTKVEVASEGGPDPKNG